MPRSPKLGFEKGSALLLEQGSWAGSGECTHPVWEGQYLPNLEANTGSRECDLLGNHPHLTCTAARSLQETHITCVSLDRETQGDLSSCWESNASWFPSRLSFEELCDVSMHPSHALGEAVCQGQGAGFCWPALSSFCNLPAVLGLSLVVVEGSNQMAFFFPNSQQAEVELSFNCMNLTVRIIFSLRNAACKWSSLLQYFQYFQLIYCWEMNLCL